MRDRPGRLMRLFFRVPPAVHAVLYRFGWADRMRARMLLLTTRGRRTGRPRTCALNYTVSDGTIYVMAGFRRSDWVANARADARVEVTLGQERWAGEARVVCDAEERRHAVAAARAQAEVQGPPRAIRPLLRRFGFDYEKELRKLDDPKADLMTVAITRVDQAAGITTVVRGDAT